MFINNVFFKYFSFIHSFIHKILGFAVMETGAYVYGTFIIHKPIIAEFIISKCNTLFVLEEWHSTEMVLQGSK